MKTASTPMFPIVLVAVLFFIGSSAFTPHPRIVKNTPRQQRGGRIHQSITNSDIKSGDVSVAADLEAKEQRSTEQRRTLGSQELLMLPRQYGPNIENVKFPQMNHVSCTVLSEAPSEDALKIAIEEAMQAHPLLRCKVEGDGEPEKRIDLFQMVREGDPDPCTFVTTNVSVDDVLTVVNVDGNDRAALDKSWKASFAKNLDDGSWCDVEKGPLWKLELHKTGSGPCALVFVFNHAISDQSSANRLTDQILRSAAELEKTGKIEHPAVKQDIPLALEDSVMGLNQRWNDVKTDGISFGTIRYIAGKAAEGLKNPVILPDADERKQGGGILSAFSIISGRAAGGEDSERQTRQSTLGFRSLSEEATTALVQKCRANGVTMSNVLTAAATLTATDFVDSGSEKKKLRNYKILQSLDMRRFGEKLDHGASFACMAGSMDLMHGPFPDRSGAALRRDPSKERIDSFWELAKEGKQQTQEFLASEGPYHAVRVFDFAMSISDMNNLVHLTAQSKDSKGRAYSAGVTNVGVYELQSGFEHNREPGRNALNLHHGKYKVEDVFFATSQTQSGCLYQVSCLTVGNELKMTFQSVAPIVSDETLARFGDAFIELLETVSGVRQVDKTLEDGANGDSSVFYIIPRNSLSIATAALGTAAVVSHAGAWGDFFSSLAAMKANTPDPSEFWAALNFWVFFAVGHPILQPILYLSDVLHGSPGPQIGNLVPVSFLAANLLFIAAVAKVKEIRNAVNIAAVAAFFAYVGAGLEGTAGLGDFNLALDDSYKGQVVRGCPAYEEVRQSSMDNFDLDKYQGKWYEHKFHDWTQFKEVYDTTLTIKLTADGKGWIDDFAVKGPAPKTAPLSWDKSPVANGAHYFLFGRVDEKDPPGVLREKGFGVEFPNYIVDVQKDPKTGEYTEAIQFQCLARGGVRVFEGINFLSRNGNMSEEELAAMHARAEKAGMYPYGASPEQMHRVAQRSDDAPDIDNNWQAMWRAIGFDKLLETLAESIEDGGR